MHRTTDSWLWAPETRWAEEVIEECAAFPSGSHDDFVDSVSQAMLRFRQGGFVKLHNDEPDEDYVPRLPNAEPYY